MPNWKKNYSTEDLDASDIPDGKQPTIKIVAIGSKDVGGQRKMQVTFEASPGFKAHLAKVCDPLPAKTSWLAAKTCGHCLAAMFGENTDGWIGKTIVIQSEQVDAFGETVEAIRVYGSPDLPRDKTIRVRQGKKKVNVALHATAKPATAPKCDRSDAAHAGTPCTASDCVLAPQPVTT